MDTKERNVLMKTRLRNLKRKYDRVCDNANIVSEELLSLKSEINSLEEQIE